MNEVKIVIEKCPIFITKVSNHNLIKKDILDNISRMDRFGLVTKGQSLTNTDWFTPTSVERPYIPIVVPVIEHHNKMLEQVIKGKIDIDNIWFQQYDKGDYHSWHVHGKSVFSNVYYVDLNNQNPKTSFRILDQEVDVEVEEGSIVTFPSFIAHCSKINQSDNIKTVISFNSNYGMS
jgi:hypothetical protein